MVEGKYPEVVQVLRDFLRMEKERLRGYGILWVLEYLRGIIN